MFFIKNYSFLPLLFSLILMAWSTFQLEAQTTLYDGNFTAQSHGPITESDVSYPYQIVSNVGCNVNDGWQFGGFDANGTSCNGCITTRALIYYGASSCDQDATLVLGGFTATQATVDVSFNYGYDDNDVTDEFTVSLFNKTQSTSQTLIGPLSTDCDDCSYSGTKNVNGGDVYEIRARYIGDFSWGATLDNVLVTEPAPTNDVDSRIESSSTLTEPTTISSTGNDAASEELAVFDFDLSDLGSGDLVNTIINSLSISQGSTNQIADWTDAIAGAKLYGPDQSSGLAGTINATTITFSGAAMITLSDGGAAETYELRIWLNSSMTNPTTIDGDLFEFQISNSGIAVNAAGSAFGAHSVESGDAGTAIAVVSTDLAFVQEPTSTTPNTAMSPAVTVEATDANGNRDTDFGANIDITSSGTLTGAPVSVAATSGLASFNSLTHTATGTGLILSAASTGLTGVNSSAFNISLNYCAAGGTSCDEYISRVQFGTIDNSTACEGGSPHYGDYTGQSTDVTIGTGYLITVTNGNPFNSDQCGVWIDWNTDGDFDDANETIAMSVTPGQGPYTATITPPVGASLGSTRMRVRVMYTGTVSSCGNATFGDVEDYSLNVLPDCTVPVAAYAVADDSCGSGQFHIDVNVTDLGDGSAVDITDGGVTAGLTNQSTGVHTLGPYAANANITITVDGTPYGGCSTQSSVLTEDCACTNQPVATVAASTPNCTNSTFDIQVTVTDFGDGTGADIYIDAALVQSSASIGNQYDFNRATGSYSVTVKAAGGSGFILCEQSYPVSAACNGLDSCGILALDITNTCQSGDLSAATNEGTLPDNPACGNGTFVRNCSAGFAPSSDYRDIWYQIDNSNGTDEVILEIKGLTGDDQVIAFLFDACGSQLEHGNVAGSVTDGFCPVFNDNDSVFVFENLASTPLIYVRVMPYTNLHDCLFISNPSDFTVCGLVTLPNDRCVNALSIDGVSQTQSICESTIETETNETGDGCALSSNDSDLWYTVSTQADDPDQLLEVSMTFDNADDTAILSLYDNGCFSNTWEECLTFGSTGTNSTVSHTFATILTDGFGGGKDYYVRVVSKSGNSMCNFTIGANRIAENNTCDIANEPFTSFDIESAQVVDFSFSTASGVNMPDNSSTTDVDLWYVFDPAIFSGNVYSTSADVTVSGLGVGEELTLVLYRRHGSLGPNCSDYAADYLNSLVITSNTTANFSCLDEQHGTSATGDGYILRILQSAGGSSAAPTVTITPSTDTSAINNTCSSIFNGSSPVNLGQSDAAHDFNSFVLLDSETLTGNFAGATDCDADIDTSLCSGVDLTADRDLWYIFKIPSSSCVDVTTSSVITDAHITYDAGSSTRDAYVYVYSACGDANLLDCSQLDGAGETLTLNGLQQGEYYLIRVKPSVLTSNLDHSFDISFNLGPVRPCYDEIQDAQEVSVLNEFDGTAPIIYSAQGATISTTAPAPENKNDVWLYFDAPDPANGFDYPLGTQDLSYVTIYVENVSGHTLSLYIYDDSTGVDHASVEIGTGGSVTGFVGAFEFIHIGHLVPGERYWIGIGHNESATTNVQFNLGVYTPGVTNSVCNGSVGAISTKVDGCEGDCQVYYQVEVPTTGFYRIEGTGNGRDVAMTVWQSDTEAGNEQDEGDPEDYDHPCQPDRNLIGAEAGSANSISTPTGCSPSSTGESAVYDLTSSRSGLRIYYWVELVDQSNGGADHGCGGAEICELNIFGPYSTAAAALSGNDAFDGSSDTTINLQSCDPADTGTVVEVVTNSIGCTHTATTITTLDGGGGPNPGNLTITCPSDTSAPTDSGLCSAVFLYPAVTASSGCGGSTVSQSSGIPSGGTFPLGGTVNNWLATDGGGATASCSFTVTIVDSLEPQIECPADTTLENDTMLCTAVLNYSIFATGNCTDTILTQSSGLASGSAFSLGATVNSFVVNASTANSVTCSFTVTVNDTESPTLSCPNDTIVNNDSGNCSAVVNYNPPSGADNCAGSTTTLSAGLGSGGTFALGINTESYITSDGAGLTAACSFTITVVDNEAPIPGCQDLTLALDGSGTVSTTANTVNSGTDNCSLSMLILSPNSFDCTDVGDQVAVLSLFDAALNSSSCEATITITNENNLTISCPGDTTIENDTLLCSAVFNYAAITHSSNCSGGSVSQTSGLSTASAFPVGSTSNTFTATDLSGANATCSFNVIVVDTEAPLALCPASITVDSDSGFCSAVVTYVAVSASDNCSGSSVSQSSGLASGAAFPVGTTINVFQATDAAGETAICNFQVTVEDVESPQIVCPGDTTIFVDSGLCVSTFFYPLPVVSDNCPGAVLTLIGGIAPGGPFSYGIDTASYAVTDAAGNSATCFFEIRNHDAQPPVITCPSDIAATTDSGSCSAVITYSLPTASDNCQVVVLTRVSGLGSGASFSLGAHTEIYLAEDIGANRDTCEFTITVSDTAKPIALCQNIAVSAVGNDSIVIDPIFIDSGSTDACGIQSLKVSQEVFSCEDLGINRTVSLTVTDLSGNTNSCTADIQVQVRGFLTTTYQKISETAGGFTGSLRNKDFFGTSMSELGDLDADGNDDIVVGAPKDNDGRSDQGAVWVLFLDDDHTVDDHQKISGTKGGFSGQLSRGDLFGSSVANVGDVNLDGVTDIAVGAPSDDDGGRNRGAVWLLNLKNNGTVSNQTKISSSTPGVNIANADNFGSSVASIGDLNADGIPDLAVGSPKANTGGADRGSIQIMFMASNGVPSSVVQLSGLDFPLGNNPVGNKDKFGSAIAGLGDIDGDGVPDIAVSAIQDDDQATNAGAVYILLMRPNGSVKSTQKISGTQGGFSGILQIGDQFGYSLASGIDLDNDGINDLLVGSNQNNDGGANKGAIWLLLLNDDGTVAQTLKVSDTHGSFSGVLEKYDRFGAAVSIIEHNTCSITIGSGANYDNDGGSNRGAVYILELGSGPAKTFDLNLASDQQLEAPQSGNSVTDEFKYEALLYPNPNMGSFNLKISDLKEERYQVIITNQIGERILYRQSDVSSGVVYEDFDISHAPAGMYFVSLYINDELLTWKVLSWR